MIGLKGSATEEEGEVEDVALDFKEIIEDFAKDTEATLELGEVFVGEGLEVKVVSMRASFSLIIIKYTVYQECVANEQRVQTGNYLYTM